MNTQTRHTEKASPTANSYTVTVVVTRLQTNIGTDNKLTTEKFVTSSF